MLSRVLLACSVSILVFSSAVQPLLAQHSATPLAESAWDEAVDGPLPRWRQGGTPAAPAGQPLYPVAHSLRTALGHPTSGVIDSPPEYAPAKGVLMRYSSSAWPTVVRDLVVGLTADPDHDEIAYVVVSGTSQQSQAQSQFAAAGADLSKVQFLTMPTDSIWLRDYGPHFIWQSGAMGVADSHYYPGRPLDNFLPTRVAEDDLGIPSYHMGLYYSGGNFQPGPGRTGFVTSLIQQDNPGFSDDYILELYHDFQGIDTLYIFPRLPGWVDATGHIDMWMYIVDEDDVIISRFLPGSDPTAITLTDNAALFMEDLGYEVTRVPAWNSGGVHYTYTNAFRVNDRIFVPIYGEGNAAYADDDVVGIAGFERAAGAGVEIVPIDCYSIIPAAGAIHCIVMQVPAHVGATPSAHVCSPHGGELLVGGTDHTLHWAASDDVEVTSIDLLYSTDGGLSFPQVIASAEPHDGYHTWTVPDTPTTDAFLQVVAHDDDGNSSEVISESAFEIANLAQHTYDFGTAAGVDRWGWGYLTASWSQLDGQRYPGMADTDIDDLRPGAYEDLAASDAGGGDSDPNRYIAPSPASGYETTHIFEFTIQEPPPVIRDMGIVWEGYGDQCIQMELYVWDHVTGNWCDGAGLAGENRYMENYAGNRDEVLEFHIRSEFERYIDSDGLMTILLYGERSGQESFHDYIAVTVSHVSQSLCSDVADCADVDQDGLRDDICMWWDCAAGTCAGTAVAFADVGGEFGACDPDGVADANDRFHALNCFSDVDTAGAAGYDCEPDPPFALNVDAGGPFGSCIPDGVCDGHDAFHALNAFQGSTSCTCPPAPSPLTGPAVPIVGVAGLIPVAADRTVSPGELVDVDVRLDGALEALRGYQLHLGTAGGHRGRIELVDIVVRAHEDRAFASQDAWHAFNVRSGQALVGQDGKGVAVFAGAYLAAFVYRVSDDAEGTFLVDVLRHEDDASQRTFLFPGDGHGRIAVEPRRAAEIRVKGSASRRTLARRR